MASSSATDGIHGEAVEMTRRVSIAGSSRGGALEKTEVRTNVSEDSVEDQNHGILATTKSTNDDLQNMRRMGKEQQLVRNFRVMSLAAFSALCTAAWEIGIFLVTPGLINGGRGGVVWSCLWSFIGFGPSTYHEHQNLIVAPD